MLKRSMLACAYAHDRSLIRTSMTEVGYADLKLMDVALDRWTRGRSAVQAAFLENVPSGRR
jgi:hypothetical protein